MALTPIVIVHAAAATCAVLAGGATLLLRKGNLAHRVLGRTWVALMLVTALSSFAIKTSGHYSWIHLLSIGTLAGLAAAVYAATQGRILAHRRGMMATYAGLVIAGTFTLLPQRLLGGLLHSGLAGLASL